MVAPAFSATIPYVSHLKKSIAALAKRIDYRLHLTNDTPFFSTFLPASWGLMIAGVGFVGASLRRRARSAARLAAT